MSLESMSAEEFNATFPVGTAVTLTDDFGRQHAALTTTPAWVLGHGKVVVNTDVKKAYGLDRLSPRQS